MLADLFDEAKRVGRIKEELDSEFLSRVVISSVEGALLICKASKDLDSFKKTAEALKRVVCPPVS